MKKPILLTSLSAMAFALVFSSCQEDETKVVQPQIQQAISKIEKSLQEGSFKKEGTDLGEKTETSYEYSEAEMQQIQKELDEIFRASRNQKTDVTSKMMSLYDVGVLASSPFWSTSCPSSYGSRAVSILMDSEDNRTATWTSGWTGSIKNNSNKNLELSFCVVDGRQFTNHKNGTYAVLQLSSYKPANTITVNRYFDNEDDGNTNRFIGDMNPNWQSWRGTSLNFLVFEADSYNGSDNLPSLGATYGVFSGYKPNSNSYYGEVHSDDEDKNNANSCTANVNGVNVNVYETWYQGFIYPGKNTNLRIAQNWAF